MTETTADTSAGPRKRDLRSLVVQARQIAEDPASPPDRLLRAAVFLVKQGFLQDSVVPLRRLVAANAYPSRVRRLGMIVGYLLRRGWGRDLATIDGTAGGGRGWKIVSFSPESDVHVAPRPGAERAVFVFAGVGPENRAAFDLTLLLQFLRGFDAHIFMMRDSRRLLYMDGLNGVGQGVDAAAARLLTIARDLGAKRFFTIGNCGGSYASLRYGLQMDAEAVLCFAPRTDYSGVLPLPDIDAGELARLDRLLSHERRDMRQVYERAGRHPRVEIFYGEGNELDSAHARHFEGLPGVSSIGVVGASGRYIVPRLFRTGEFENAVGRLLDLPVIRPAAVRRAAPRAGTPA
jgi:hypothetical protein